MSEVHRIRGSKIGHRFDGAWLFRGLSFEFAAGEVVAVRGPSGCGKTTLLSLLARWLRPQEGSVEYVGVRRVSWVFQNPLGAARRSAVDHVAFPLLAAGLSPRDARPRALAIMKRFSIEDVAEQSFGALSGGEAQRLMLARALAARSDVLLVDEPTAQLDRSSARTVNATLGEVAGAGRIVVVATHDSETAAACDYALDLQAGAR